MKTIQCANPPHHHNGFVATCRLWTVIGGVHALLVLEPTTNFHLTSVQLQLNPNIYFSIFGSISSCCFISEKNALIRIRKLL